MDDLGLNNRAGLPPELRVLADLYPREMWRGHANFSGMTAFWLDRHGMFRELSAKLIEQAQIQLDTPDARFIPDMSRYASFLLNQLHTHHSVEDHHYFPRLQVLDSRVERAFELLDADHHALDGQLQALADAANHAIRSEADKDAVAALLQAEDRLQRFLDRHLADEEDVVVPLILEYAPDLE